MTVVLPQVRGAAYEGLVGAESSVETATTEQVRDLRSKLKDARALIRELTKDPLNVGADFRSSVSGAFTMRAPDRDVVLHAIAERLTWDDLDDEVRAQNDDLDRSLDSESSVMGAGSSMLYVLETQIPRTIAYSARTLSLLRRRSIQN